MQHALKYRNNNRIYRIGIDCHRTILDIGSAIQRLAWDQFSTYIPTKATRTERGVEKYIHPDTFRLIRDIVVTKERYMSQHVKEIPGAIKAIRELQSDGHVVEMVTSSGHPAHIAILKWLMRHRVDLPTRSVGRRVLKGFIAENYDIFLDDTPQQAEECLFNGTAYVYLLDSPTNQGLGVSEQITRVENFEEFLQHVRRLSQKSSYPPPASSPL